MQLRSQQSFNDQEALILLAGKKTETFEELPGLLREEWERFTRQSSEQQTYKLNGKYYIFVGEQKNDEQWRVAGHKVRTFLPKTVKSVCIAGGKQQGLLLAEGLLLSNYQFLEYRKNAAEERNALETIDFTGKPAERDLKELTSIVRAVCWARDLVNEPASALNATTLAAAIEIKGREAGFSVKVLEKSMIESLKMGGLLAVNKGSEEPPTFSILEYKPKKAINKKPIVLVGKGVTYDTGGLSLKPTAGSMDLMKSDMAGAACMAATVYAAALLELPVSLVALIPATDNRPGGSAYAPGDIVRMYDGTTVEVRNTDAEGRMILADALAYSDKWKPQLVIDAATLTGAALRAIGTRASVIMGNAEDYYFQLLEEAGNATHERVVRLPFWDDYFEEMKSGIADLNNLGGPNAGMITAGKFLEHFVKAPYIHMDIAGPAFLEKPQDYKGTGGTGTGVRLLINFLKRLN